MSEARHVWNPKDLPVHLDVTQTILRKIFFFQTKKGEMRKVAKHRLKPSMLRHNLSHAGVFELVNIESKHRNMLRRSRCSDRIKNRLRKIFAEIDSILFEFEYFGYLL